MRLFPQGLGLRETSRTSIRITDPEENQYCMQQYIYIYRKHFSIEIDWTCGGRETFHEIEKFGLVLY